MREGTAIITVTQGDWQYLEEWIDYHHNIGVDMFFIGYNGPKDLFYKLPKYDYVRYYDYATDPKDPTRSYMYLSGNKTFSTWANENESEYNMMIMQQVENQLLREILYFFPFIKYTCVIDTDEFLDIHTEDNNITEFLSKNLPDINSSIIIQMRFYGDNEQIYNDKTKGVIERFTKPLPKMSVTEDYGWGKMIINMCHQDVRDGKIRMLSPHTCSKFLKYFILDTNKIELRHYWTKSLEEWIMKLSPRFDKDYLRRFGNNVFGEFFKWNIVTLKKLKTIPKLLAKYDVKYNPCNETNKSLAYKYAKANNLEFKL